MIVTNKLGLPDAIVEAVRNDEYSAGDCDISCTTLIGPARINALRKLHGHEIVEDASDRIWSLFGQVVHSILERADVGNDSVVAEKRLFAEVNGWRISGQLDRFNKETGVLDDYKTTSVYSVMGDLKEDWIDQLNVLAYLCRRDGLDVKSLRIVAILRDWSRAKLRQNKDGTYPVQNVVMLDIPLLPDDEVEDYICERIDIHRSAIECERQEDIPYCTEMERWQAPTTFAVMKKADSKRARKLFADYAEANDYRIATGSALIVERPAVAKRCELYCPVASFCDCNPYKD